MTESDKFEQGNDKVMRPSFLITQFKTDKEFFEWAMLGTVQDLRKAIEAFRNDFCDNYVGLLQSALNEKLAYLQ